ncbi:MAG: hypothetical protein OXH69_18310 [Acidobacteria bacterium]|nr:hypothetical protein [Acidobacteriota bacterium]
MQCRTPHPTDDELLLLDDPQALGGRRGRTVRQHVAECAGCTARRSRLAADLAEVASLWRTPAAEDAMRRVPGVGRGAAEAERAHRAARVRLATALDAQAARDAAGWLRLPAGARSLLPVGAAALVALALLMVQQLPSVVPPDAGHPSVAALEDPPAVPLRLLPDRRLTPGAVRPVTAAETCGGDLPSVPAAAAGVPRQVFAQYGIDYRRAAEYELDFLITPELGGAADPRNLWPQPYGATVWNAYVKDELEQHLGRMVCAGTLDLDTAQRDIATDWIGAYRRYFDTSHPRRDYRRFPLTGRGGETPARMQIEFRLLLPPAAAVVAGSTGTRGGIEARMDRVPARDSAGGREALPRGRSSHPAVARRS